MPCEGFDPEFAGGAVSGRGFLPKKRKGISYLRGEQRVRLEGPWPKHVKAPLHRGQKSYIT